MRMKLIAALIASYFRPQAASASGRSFVMPPGVVATLPSIYMPWAEMQNLDQADATGFTTVSSSSQTLTASAASVAGGILNRTGSPAGAVAETTPTALLLIAALPNTIQLDGTFQYRFRYINNALGQTVTWTAGTGVTVTGTATIATNSWRDFLVTVDSASAVTMTNIGGGSL